MLLLENHVPLKTLLNPKEQQDRESKVEGLGALSHPLRATCKAEHRQPVHGSIGPKGTAWVPGLQSKGPKALSLGREPGRGSQGPEGHSAGAEIRVCTTKVGPWVSSRCCGLAPGKRKVWEEVPEGPRPDVWRPENFQS